MEKYIPLNALAAEIESLLDKGKYHDEYDCAYRDGNNGALYALKEKVNSLEVKEVDKNNEIVDKLNDIINFHKEKVYKGQWYKWMREKVSYHNGVISGIKQCLSIIRNK